MGVDIHTFVEIKDQETGKWNLYNENVFKGNYDNMSSCPFNWRYYFMFDFLEKQSCEYNLPSDVSDYIKELYESSHIYYSASWISLKKLLDFDYNKKIDKDISSTYYQWLNFTGNFFQNISILNALGHPEDVRVIFWFDN
jgi:hypothetical protein